MISAHGTIVRLNGTAIAELGTVTPPALERPSFDTTMRDEDDDVYRMDIRRTGLLTFEISLLLMDDPTHQAILAAWAANSEDDWTVEFTDGATWSFLGQVQAIQPSNPVDGKWSAQIAVRPTTGVDLSGLQLLTQTNVPILTQENEAILL